MDLHKQENLIFLEFHFFTNIGIITGEINDDLVEMFVRFEQEVETKLGIPEKPDSKLRDGSFIALSNVIITQPSGCKMELSHFILFSDQIIGATLSDLELIPK